MLEHYYLRRPTQNDINNVLALMIRCDQRDVGFPDSDLTDLKADWEGIDLSQDAWLAIDKHHVLQGYGAVLPWNTGKIIAVYDAPGAEDSDLFLSLTVLCEGRARFLLREANDPEQQTLVAYISESVAHQKQVLTDAGYAVTKHLFNFHRDLDDDPPAPVWPAGVTLRTVKPGADDRALHTLIQDAFDKPGRTPQSFEDWHTFMMHPERFIPDLWFLLEKEGELIGCVLCFDYTDLGWVRQLAVRADQRGAGLGRMLLQHAFHVFKERAYPKAGLAVDCDNTNALQLYTSVGLREVVHLNEFSKKIT
ncbi:MAG: GNAT family N-acetyltransferase [Pelolinea sp.]|nr:GNAT family N-acetyltransferase [Pelolinea sp.]